MTTYIVYNRVTGQELEYDDLQHAQSELRHLAMKEQQDSNNLNTNWSMFSHIT